MIGDIPDQLVTTGFNVTFNCNAEGSDDVSYRWNRIYSETMVERGFSTIIPGRVFGETTATLTIRNVGVDDEGEYACFVNVGGTHVGTRTASLTTQSEYQHFWRHLCISMIPQDSSIPQPTMVARAALTGCRSIIL